jgi:hypothetical protein
VSPGWLQIVRGGVPDFIIVEWKFNPSKAKQVQRAGTPTHLRVSAANKVLRLSFSFSLS